MFGLVTPSAGRWSLPGVSLSRSPREDISERDVVVASLAICNARSPRWGHRSAPEPGWQPRPPSNADRRADPSGQIPRRNPCGRPVARMHLRPAARAPVRVASRCRREPPREGGHDTGAGTRGPRGAALATPSAWSLVVLLSLNGVACTSSTGGGGRRRRRERVGVGVRSRRRRRRTSRDGERHHQRHGRRWRERLLFQRQRERLFVRRHWRDRQRHWRKRLLVQQRRDRRRRRVRGADGVPRGRG